jgi:hypothetical protein
MTDRVHSLLVVLDQNYREDDIQKLVDAIAMFAGVVDVQKNVADAESYVVQRRVFNEMRERMLNAMLREGESQIAVSLGLKT